MKSIVQAYIIKKKFKELITGFIAHFIGFIERLTTSFKKLIQNFVKLVYRTLFSYILCGVTLFVCAEQILRQSARKVSNWMVGRKEENGNLFNYLGLFLVASFALILMKTLFMQDPLIICLVTVTTTIQITFTETDAFGTGGNEYSILNIAKVYPEVQRRIEKRWAQNKGDDIGQEVDQYFKKEDNDRSECSIN